MLNSILRRLVSCDQPNDPAARQRAGALAGGVGVAANLLLFVGKLTAGLLTGAISVTADAFNNLSDAAGSLVTLAGFRLAGQRADAEHPFGHGRMEYLAGLVVSLLILLVGVELGKSSIGKILEPETAVLTLPAALLLVLSILIKLGMTWFYRALGAKTDSATLRAAAVDSRADALATGAILLGLILTPFFGPALDGWLGLVVAVLILRSGWLAAKDTLDPLLGQPPDPTMVRDIETLILSHPQVSGIHDLVIHDYGPGRRMMSVHAEVPAQAPLLEIHGVIDHIERELTDRFGLEAVIHMDPVQTGDPRIDSLRRTVEEAAREIDHAATIHDFRAEGPDGLDLRFDVVVPYDVPLTDGQVRTALEETLRSKLPNCRPGICVDRSHVL